MLITRFSMKKRIIAFITGLTLGTSLFSAAFADDAVHSTDVSSSPRTETRSITQIDAVTGEITEKEVTIELSGASSGSAPGYYPNGNEFAPTPFGMVGPTNDMIPVTNSKIGPAQYVASLQVSATAGTFVGTGTLVAPGVILTCAHNIYNSQFGGDNYAKSMLITPGRQGAHDTAGSYQVNLNASTYIISSNFLKGESWDDWALIFLDGANTGYSGIAWDGNYANYVNTAAFSYGYPAQQWPAVDDGTNGAGTSTPWVMYQSIGYIRKSDAHTLKGDWDMVGGFSGGPLMQYRENAGYCVIGINRDGNGKDNHWQSYPTSFSGARPMDEFLFNLIMQYR